MAFRFLAYGRISKLGQKPYFQLIRRIGRGGGSTATNLWGKIFHFENGQYFLHEIHIRRSATQSLASTNAIRIDYSCLDNIFCRRNLKKLVNHGLF